MLNPLDHVILAHVILAHQLQADADRQKALAPLARVQVHEVEAAVRSIDRELAVGLLERERILRVRPCTVVGHHHDDGLVAHGLDHVRERPQLVDRPQDSGTLDATLDGPEEEAEGGEEETTTEE